MRPEQREEEKKHLQSFIELYDEIEIESYEQLDSDPPDSTIIINGEKISV